MENSLIWGVCRSSHYKSSEIKTDNVSTSTKSPPDDVKKDNTIFSLCHFYLTRFSNNKKIGGILINFQKNSPK
jgi:hypothetical protein